jgi:RNA polymerase sigma factor (TIGR02999 family)
MIPASEDRESFDRLFSLVYEELRALAGKVLRSEFGNHLTPTTLVHEAWIKLAHSPELAQTSRLHFRRIAARAMRQVLVEAARRRHAARRGDPDSFVTFEEWLPGAPPHSDAKDILALDHALEVLSRVSERQARLVEGRFFGGLEMGELAELLQVSEATVTREWRSARAWLAVEIKRSLTGAGGMGEGRGGDVAS